MIGTSESSFELLSNAAKNDLFFKLSNLFLEFNKVF